MDIKLIHRIRYGACDCPECRPTPFLLRDDILALAIVVATTAALIVWRLLS